jgi:hypothetical protein
LAVAVTVAGRPAASPVTETLTGWSIGAIAGDTLMAASSTPRSPEVHPITPTASTTLTNTDTAHRATQDSYPSVP